MPPIETDEQIIARKEREARVRNAWRSFSGTRAAKREYFAKRFAMRRMFVGEIIQEGDFFLTGHGRNDFSLAPKHHIGKPVRQPGSHRTSRPPPAQ